MALRAEVSELKSRLNQNSNNSHKPPSSDPYRKAATTGRRVENEAEKKVTKAKEWTGYNLK
ncbi:MAG: transposase [Saprospiraceae bacterium]|nr:transposase [Saprospiraceae bacterium]